MQYVRHRRDKDSRRAGYVHRHSEELGALYLREGFVVVWQYLGRALLWLGLGRFSWECCGGFVVGAAVVGAVFRAAQHPRGPVWLLALLVFLLLLLQQGCIRIWAIVLI